MRGQLKNTALRIWVDPIPDAALAPRANLWDVSCHGAGHTERKRAHAKMRGVMEKSLTSREPTKTRGLRAASILVGMLMVAGPGMAWSAQRPANIVDVRSLIPDIALDIRYFGSHNFIGRPIPGYDAPKCLLTHRAAEGLSQVQAELRGMGLTLKVYDCYRPQQAVDYFVEWAEDLSDQEMKPEFYPAVDKRNLFRDGYIAARSGHSRGSTVDLTIMPLTVPESDILADTAELRSCEGSVEDRFPDGSLDMGTGYDCFSVLSHTINPDIGPQQRANRLLLKNLMESAGFENLPEEWWHFTLSNEPYPESYFDFEIQ